MAKTNEVPGKDTKMPFVRANRSSNLSMGIVGLPNVGKSTLFNRLTRNSVRAENFPFCTIDPSTGHVKIEDPRIKFLESVYKPRRTVHAFLSVVDIAGLVKGASEGEGLGNKFLDNIRNVDGIFLVVRCFDNPEIIHVESSIDPLRDIQTIKDELRIKDKEILERALAKADRDTKSKPLDKRLEKELSTLRRMIKILDTKWISEEHYDQDELQYINTLNLLTTKNVVILANISPGHYEKRKANSHLKAVMKEFGDSVIPFSATAGMDDAAAPFPDEFINKLVSKAYQSLNLINFFTAGKDEVKSWTITRGDKAPKAGGVIHSDFEKYFMSAEVMNYNEFLNHPSEAQMRAAGKYLQKGKDYVVNDGDIILFKFNAPKSGSKK